MEAITTANNSIVGNKSVVSTTADYTGIITTGVNFTSEGNTTEMNVSLSNTTVPTISHSNYGFYITTFLVFTPGMLAHILALYCLLSEVGKKMMFAKRLLLGLCVVDIIGLCAIFFHHAIGVYVTNPPVALCAVTSFLMGFLPLMSGALTTYIAVERCVKFYAPFWHNMNAATWRMKLPIIITGLVLAIIALLPTFGFGYIISQDGRKRCSTVPTKVPRMYNSPEGIFIITYATVGLITVAVDVTSNIITIITLTSVRERRLNISGAKEGKSAEMAMTRMLFFLSCVFLITLTPLYVSLVALYAGIQLSQTVKTVTHLLSGLNFTLDPFIYLTTIKSYRRKVANLFCCCRKDISKESGQVNKSASSKESDDKRADNVYDNTGDN